jgi:hypothetical protein
MASDSSFRELQGALNCRRVDDKASTAVERGKPLRVETSSSRHFPAPSFVARWVLFFEQMLSMRKSRRTPRCCTRPTDRILAAHQGWTLAELNSLFSAISFKSD